MLVRWNEIPEADRNGLVLGYKVSPGSQDAPSRVPCPHDPWGPGLRLLQWIHGGSRKLCSGRHGNQGLLPQDWEASREAQVLGEAPSLPPQSP